MKKAVLSLLVILSAVVLGVFTYQQIDKPVALNIHEQAQYYLGEPEGEANVTALSDDMGEVTGGGRYHVGDEVTLTATANYGFYFQKWQVKNNDAFEDWTNDDGSVRTSSTTKFIVDGDIEVKAVFLYQSYKLTADFSEYFSLDKVEFTSGGADAGNYTRATKENFNTDGKFFYRDVAKICYKETEGKFVGRLNYQNFTTNSGKTLVIYSVNEDGYLISKDVNGVIQNFVQNSTKEDSVIKDFEQYDYIFLTQKEAGGGKYFTKSVRVETKIDRDITFTLKTNLLLTVELKASLSKDGKEEPLSIKNVTDLISFQYGYYSELENGEETKKYLVEQSANFRITIASNQEYQYLYTYEYSKNFSNDIYGYFNNALSVINVVFEKIEYSVTISEMLKEDDGVISPLNFAYLDFSEILNNDRINLVVGDKLAIDFDKLTLKVNEEETKLQKKGVFGYKLFAITSSLEDIQSNGGSFEVTIPKEKPTNVNVYIIYEKIEYDLKFYVLDSTHTESKYFAGNLSYISPDTKIKTGDTINLTAEPKVGYEVLGWVQKNGEGWTDKLTNYSFIFEPKSDEDLTIDYYVMVDFDYFDLTYELDPRSIFSSSTYMAKLSLAIIDYFEFDETGKTLKIYGRNLTDDKNNLSESTSELIYQETLTNSSEQDNIVRYSAQIGDIISLKNEEKFVSLTFDRKTYLADETSSTQLKFKKAEEKSKKAIECEYNKTETYSYKLTNLTIEDLVLIKSQSSNFSLYKFAYFTLDSGASTTNYFSSDKFTNGTSEDNNNYIGTIFNKLSDSTLRAFYIQKNQQVQVRTSNPAAYTLGDIQVKVTPGEHNQSGTSGSKTEGDVIVITAQPEDTIEITIDISKISVGYRFVAFMQQQITSEGKFEKTKINEATEGADTIVLNLTMSNSYAGCDIIVEFEEIEFKVNIEASIKGSSGSSIGFNTKTFKGADVDSSFTIKISDVNDNINLPTFRLDSATGYYISNVYMNEDNDDNKITELIGDNRLYGVREFTFTYDNFLKYIFNLKNEENVVTLHIEQTIRNYTLTVRFKDNALASVMHAQVQLTYGEGAESVTLTLQPERSENGGGILYYIEFAEIDFGTEVTLTYLDNRDVSGIFFKCFEDEELKQYSNNHEDGDPKYTCTISKDTTVFINFSLIYYNLEFKSYDGNEESPKLDDTLKSNTELFYYTVDGVPFSTEMKYGSEVIFYVADPVGYLFESVYYSRLLGTSSEGIYPDDSDRINMKKYYFYFVPTTFLQGISKEQQMQETQTFTLNLGFTIKLYELSLSILNSSSFNPTGVPVEEWGDAEKCVILNKRLNGMNSVGDNIEVHFATQFVGIKFDKVRLNSPYFELKSSNNVANQYVELYFDAENGYYVLKFNLNSELLATSPDEMFNVNVYYMLKPYTITLTSNVIEGKNGLSLSFQRAIDGKSVTDQALSTYPNYVIYYGEEITWTINGDKAVNNFNDSYIFGYFDIMGYRFNYQEYNIFNPSSQVAFSFKMSDTIEVEGKIMSIWEIIGSSDNEVVITAMYNPKFRLNPDNFTFVDGNYVKTTIYNAKSQRLTMSSDPDLVGDPDIYFNKDMFTSDNAFVVKYNGSITLEPKNAGEYAITITLGKFIFENIKLIITKCPLTLVYTGDMITKTYDGTIMLTPNNVNYLTRNVFKLNNIQGDDIITLKFNLSGYFSDSIVGNQWDVVISSGIELSSDQNYFIENLKDSGFTISKKGEITPFTLNLNSNAYRFNDIVYKEGQEANLKYIINEVSMRFIEALPYDLADEVELDMEKIKFRLLNYSIGNDRTIIVSLSDALKGADSGNYRINDLNYIIDIHPYELRVEIQNRGVVRIVDLDELCVIPTSLNSNSLRVRYFDSTVPEYADANEIISDYLRRNDRFDCGYFISIIGASGNEVSLNVLTGAYLELLYTRDAAKIYNYDSNGNVNELNIYSNDKKLSVKIDSNIMNNFAVIVNRTYFSIWRIIWIIIIILLILLLLIILIIWIYKKVREKHQYDKENAEAKKANNKF